MFCFQHMKAGTPFQIIVLGGRQTLRRSPPLTRRKERGDGRRRVDCPCRFDAPRRNRPHGSGGGLYLWQCHTSTAKSLVVMLYAYVQADPSGFFPDPRRARKKSRSSALHSASRHPYSTVRACTVAGWLWTDQTLPIAPAAGSRVPHTTRPMRAPRIAPAHIGQGSSVTYRVQSARRHAPHARQASPIALISACPSAV